MHHLSEVAPEVEIYSVDEAFLGLHGTARYLDSLEKYARTIRAKVRQRTHIPACVGIAPPKPWPSSPPASPSGAPVSTAF